MRLLEVVVRLVERGCPGQEVLPVLRQAIDAVKGLEARAGLVEEVLAEVDELIRVYGAPDSDALVGFMKGQSGRTDLTFGELLWLAAKQSDICRRYQQRMAPGAEPNTEPRPDPVSRPEDWTAEG